MSAFTDRQGKGAMTARRATKREEAEERNRRSSASMRMCGHVHGDTIMCQETAR